MKPLQTIIASTLALSASLSGIIGCGAQDVVKYPKEDLTVRFSKKKAVQQLTEEDVKESVYFVGKKGEREFSIQRNIYSYAPPEVSLTNVEVHGNLNLSVDAIVSYIDSYAPDSLEYVSLVEEKKGVVEKEKSFLTKKICLGGDNSPRKCHFNLSFWQQGTIFYEPRTYKFMIELKEYGKEPIRSEPFLVHLNESYFIKKKE